MEVFSSAQITNSPSPSGSPSNALAYRSSTLAALAAKSGSLGKIHERCSQGLMASSRKIRQTVAAEMNATTPLRMSCLANSAQLQRDSGAPLVTGNSQASALSSAPTEGGKTRGRPERARSCRPFIRCSKKRLRQRHTTWGLVSSRAAISTLASPPAASSTILALATRQ